VNPRRSFFQRRAQKWGHSRFQIPPSLTGPAWKQITKKPYTPAGKQNASPLYERVEVPAKDGSAAGAGLVLGGCNFLDKDCVTVTIVVSGCAIENVQ